MTDYKYYQVDFGILVDGERPSDCEDGCSMIIKAKRKLSIKEAEEYLKEDMEMYNCNCVYDIFETTEHEVYAGYDTNDIDNWPVFC